MAPVGPGISGVIGEALQSLANLGIEELRAIEKMLGIHGEALDQLLAGGAGARVELAERGPGRLGVDEVDGPESFGLLEGFWPSVSSATRPRI